MKKIYEVNILLSKYSNIIYLCYVPYYILVNKNL